MIRFYDTNALLELEKHDEYFYISSVTLQELEAIKSSSGKSEEVKYKARRAAKLLRDNQDKFSIVGYFKSMKDIIDSFGLEESPDNKICACAKWLAMRGEDDLMFITNDVCCHLMAKIFFGLNVEPLKSKVANYIGYKEVVLDAEQLAHLYENLSVNQFDLIPNEYLIVKNDEGDVIDKFKWNGEYHKTVVDKTIKSNMFGTIRPLDEIQACAIDSISNNQITMIKGKAGTGKSLLALAVLFQLLEKHKIEKIVIFCNTVATANSAKLGYYPGSREEKLRDSNIGNILSSKLGSMYLVERLMMEERLVLLPMSDIRGYDTTGMNAGVYITEAQNLDISLMKLALQRIGEDSICIIDGDNNTQVDLVQYAGERNGMKRMSEIFRGQDFYGEIELRNIHRSKIAQIADKM